MTSVAIGVLVGRVIFSYLLIFIIVLIFSKFKFKLAYQRVHSWKGMTAVALVLVLPVLATMGLRI